MFWTLGPRDGVETSKSAAVGYSCFVSTLSQGGRYPHLVLGNHLLGIECLRESMIDIMDIVGTLEDGGTLSFWLGILCVVQFQESSPAGEPR